MNRSKKLDGRIRKLKGLKNFKDYPINKLEEIAKEQLKKEESKKLPDSVQNIPLETKEKNIFKEIYDRYIKAYNITDEVEKDALSDLVYNKIIKLRYQQLIYDLKKKGTDAPGAQIKEYHTVTAEILKLEKTLGLFSEKKEETPFTYVERLKKRFRVWLNKNQGSRECICPHCSKTMLLKIRTDKYDATKHPFFEDRILTNKKIIELYLDDRITREEVGEILETSKFYVDWDLEKHLNKNNPLYKKFLEKMEREKREKENKEEICKK